MKGCLLVSFNFNYVVCVGNSIDGILPEIASPTEHDAIMLAKSLQDEFSFVEVVYIPENNSDVNKVVYANFTR